MRPPARAYRAAGLTIVSPLPLGALPSRAKPPPDAWRLSLRRRRFPFAVPRPGPRGYGLRVRPDGSLVLAWPGHGTFWLRPGPKRIDYRADAAEGEDRFFDVLIVPVLSFLLVLEGRDPLHGSAVELDGRAVAFLGRSGAGKSTSAASLVLHGQGRLVADDLLAFDLEGGRARARPGNPELRLWPASAKRLVTADGGLPRLSKGTSKRRLRAALARRSPPLSVVYELRPARRGRARAEALQGQAAFRMLAGHLFNRHLDGPEARLRRFERLSGLARAVQVRRLTWPRGAGGARELARFVRDDLRRTGA